MNEKMENILQSIIDNLKGFESEISSVGKDYYHYDRKATATHPNQHGRL